MNRKRINKPNGYILMDALVTLFLVSVAFAGLLSFEALLVKAAGEQRKGVIELAEERNAMGLYGTITFNK